MAPSFRLMSMYRDRDRPDPTGESTASRRIRNGWRRRVRDRRRRRFRTPEIFAPAEALVPAPPAPRLHHALGRSRRPRLPESARDGPWGERRTYDNGISRDVGIKHLDATDRAAERRRQLDRLEDGDHNAGITNVGIFGEGTDTPSLDAVAILAPRKSPTDVIQIVGRCMRRSPEKTTGYVIVPVPLPRGLDAETSLGMDVLGRRMEAARPDPHRAPARTTAASRIARRTSWTFTFRLTPRVMSRSP